MPTKTNEQAFEYAIEKALTGTCLEELKENPNGVADRQEIYRSGQGYHIGFASDFNAIHGSGSGTSSRTEFTERPCVSPVIVHPASP